MPRSSLLLGAVAAFALCLLLVPSVTACETDEAGATAPGSEPAISSRVFYVDPDSGEVFRQRPIKRRSIGVPAERLPGLSWSHADVQFLTLPDGTMAAGRPGGFRSALVASLGPDGRLSMTHLDGKISEAPAEDRARLAVCPVEIEEGVCHE